MTDPLHEWLPTQRWFGGKGRAITGVTEASATPLSDDVRLVVVDVTYDDGGHDAYQLLLGPDGTDAAHDPVVMALLLEHLAVGKHLDGVHFQSHSDLDTSLPGRPMGVEQSNTSVVFGEQLVLKLFRRLQPGANPDIEVTKALADAGSPHVAPPLAWMDGTVGGEVTTLGLLQPFLRGASEGWAMATASVRDLFAEQDLRADEVGGDFASESERLGVATGEVHRLLASVLESRTAGPQESQQTAQQLAERLEAALAVVPELAPFAEGLRASYALVGGRTDPVAVQRVHGDFHLGQVLRTQEGWVLLDFEGEPTRPLSERRALMSPLRDVAGMLRSFDYASHHLLEDRGPNLAFRAAEWAERNRSAFCDGYARAVGSDPRDEAVLLRAFELDKAVYEVVYEARNRPTWLHVPLGSIERLVAG